MSARDWMGLILVLMVLLLGIGQIARPNIDDRCALKHDANNNPVTVCDG